MYLLYCQPLTAKFTNEGRWPLLASLGTKTHMYTHRYIHARNFKVNFFKSSQASESACSIEETGVISSSSMQTNASDVIIRTRTRGLCSENTMQNESQLCSPWGGAPAKVHSSITWENLNHDRGSSLERLTAGWRRMEFHIGTLS